MGKCRMPHIKMGKCRMPHIKMGKCRMPPYYNPSPIYSGECRQQLYPLTNHFKRDDGDEDGEKWTPVLYMLRVGCSCKLPDNSFFKPFVAAG